MAGRAAQGPMLGLEAFKGADFRVEALMDRLAAPLLQALAEPSGAAGIGAASRGIGTAHAVPLDAVSKCQQLLDHFERAERDLVRLQHSVDARVETLLRDVTARHGAFERQVLGLEGAQEALQSQFQVLDDRMASAAQVATRIGDRLQTAEMFRERAVEAIDIIQYLQDFSRTTDFSDLHEVFRHPEHLDRAAALTGRMQALTEELGRQKERAGVAAPVALLPSDAAQPGTVEYAAAKLEEFRESLEMKVVERFDAAASKGDTAAMKTCAGIMSNFARGTDILINRYIASRPMFLDVREIQGLAPPDGSAEPPGAALQRLNGLFKSISSAVTKEAAAMQRIFPNPAAATAAFVTRIFEQRLKLALDGLLVVPDASEPPEALEQYLQLLAEAYSRTHGLASRLQPLAGPNCNTAGLADMVFAEALEEYIELELAWLQQLYETKSPHAESLSLQLVTDCLSWNRKAVDRSKVVCPDSGRPAAVRALFHSSTVDSASIGCLLEQVASHVIGGLSEAVEQARRASAKPFQPTAEMRSPALLNKAAYPVASQGIAKVLSAVNTASSIMRLLRQHYAEVVEPAVEVSPQEASSCATGLLALTRAVEDRVTAALAAALNALASQVDRTLSAEQKKADFQAKEGGPALELERPTEAAVLATALLRAAVRVATANLHGANLASFLAQLGRQVHGVLMGHMQRFTYSATGALRWKRDVTEYADWARALRSPILNDRFQELQALANVLVVVPEALLGLVDGSLRLSHSAALKFIRLREDFRIARLPGNVTLASVFNQD